ncbi:MFS transporter [Candidatus Micrarchaeota archaeon]|nr:MFS transporter [Candidatus Micrarchaeota archaeon]
MGNRSIKDTKVNKQNESLSRNVLLLGIVSLFNDISSEMIMPILPMFISALGGGGLVIGLIGGLRDSVSSILKVFAGYWSDKTGKRKVFVYSGYVTSILFKFFLFFSTAWQHVLVFASLERVGKGLRTAPRDAIIADSMPKKRGKGFGIHRMLDTSGAVIGSAIALLLFWFLGFDFKTIILSAAVIGFLSLVPLFFVKEKARKPKDISFKLSIKRLPGNLRTFIIISSIFALANFSYMFFILKAQREFSGDFAVITPLLLYILFNIFYALFAVPFGMLSDRFGRRNVLIIGYSLFAITSLGFALFNSLFAFIVLFILYGMSNAIVNSNQRAYVSDLSPEKLRATALGTFHTMTGLAVLPASVIAGALWQFNPPLTFIYGSALSTLTVMLFIAFRIE